VLKWIYFNKEEGDARMANEETYWIPGKGEGEVQLTYNHMQLLLELIVEERGGVDPKLLEERVGWLKGVLKKSLWVTSEMVRVQGGTFRMGKTRDDPEEEEWEKNEKPVHEVELTYDYWMGRFPVVFAEYDQYCREKGLKLAYADGMGRGNRPVIWVDWNDAIGYCNWLSEKEGLAVAYDSKGYLLDSNGRQTTDITQVEGYRLPTEAEWEYAARGGQKATKDWLYAGSDNLGEVGWYRQNSGDKWLPEDEHTEWGLSTIEANNCRTHPVGKKAPNELGLYDMSGNVSEWCYDGYGNYGSSSQTNPTRFTYLAGCQVIRGGGWYASARDCRVTARNLDYLPSSSGPHGFRLARTVIK